MKIDSRALIKCVKKGNVKDAKAERKIGVENEGHETY